MLTAETFIERREELSKRIDSGLILLLGHDESPMNYADNVYPFRQDGSFLYYVGLNSPGMAALLDIEEGVGELFALDPMVNNISNVKKMANEYIRENQKHIISFN